jgi:hypothetical protein
MLKVGSSIVRGRGFLLLRIDIFFFVKTRSSHHSRINRSFTRDPSSPLDALLVPFRCRSSSSLPSTIIALPLATSGLVAITVTEIIALPSIPF